MLLPFLLLLLLLPRWWMDVDCLTHIALAAWRKSRSTSKAFSDKCVCARSFPNYQMHTSPDPMPPPARFLHLIDICRFGHLWKACAGRSRVADALVSCCAVSAACGALGGHVAVVHLICLQLRLWRKVQQLSLVAFV